MVFVNYINRSGSTYLCRLLDDFEDISVGIEGGFPGFTAKLIPPQYETIGDDRSLREYLSALFNDIRIKQWNLDPDVLFAKMSAAGYPLTFREILTTCMQSYFGDVESHIWLHKAGYYIECLEDVHRTFPGAKNIFVVRDPRAIYNSQKSATDIYSGKKMGTTPFNLVDLYRRRVHILEQNRNNSDLKVVVYEELITETGRILDDALEFVGLRNRDRKKEGSYFERIPENQRHLHPNVDAKPLKERIDKWATELGPAEIRFIERRLAKEMRIYGYTNSGIGLSLPDRLTYCILLFHYGLYRLIKGTKSVRHKLFVRQG